MAHQLKRASTNKGRFWEGEGAMTKLQCAAWRGMRSNGQPATP